MLTRTQADPARIPQGFPGSALGAEGPYQDSVKAQVRKDNPGLTASEYDRRAVAAAKKKSVAIGFLKRGDKKRYGGLWSKLENQYTRGTDDYPSDLTGSYNLLLNYKPPPFQQYGQCEDRADEEEISGMTFLQNSAPVPGTDGVTHEQIKCYNCQHTGHYAGECPQESRDQQGVQLLQVAQDSDLTTVDKTYVSEFTFLQVEEVPGDFSFYQSNTRYEIIPSTWILLDSQSTVSVFKNRRLLSDIQPSKKKLRVHTNGGVQMYAQVGTIRNFGDVRFNADSLTNILSMAAVRKVCRITMDTSVEAAMNVHRKDGTIMKFREYTSGLYYYDAREHRAASNPSSTSQDYICLNTVAGNKASLTRLEIEGADKARTLYRKIGHPAEQEYNEILDNNSIRNCPVTSDDARRALHIYGPELTAIKGKTVKKQNKGIPNYLPIQIPAPIIEKYKNIRIFMDIFWVNGSPFSNRYQKTSSSVRSRQSTTDQRGRC
jgi:hypothetical protein